MKSAFPILVLTLLIVASAFAQPAATQPVTQPAAAPAQLSATFTDILSRVAERDPETQAILRINLRPDTPDAPSGRTDNEIQFSIRPPPLGGTGYQIRIYPDTFNGYADLESYFLKSDPSIEMEKERLDAYLTKHAHQQKVAGEANIAKLSQGKLKYGMTSAEVQKITGPFQGSMSRKPRGYTEDIYPLCNCIFNYDNILVDAREHSKLELINQPAAQPATPPADVPAHPSTAFTDILSRVAERDPETQAILRMNLRPDAPESFHPDQKNILTIHKGKDDNAYYLRIYPLGYMAFTDYESYIVKPDPRIELENQRIEAYKHKLYLQEKAAGEANITKFSQGNLKYGMTVAEVQITGPSQGYTSWQAFGYIENTYPLCNCIFDWDTLVDARERGKPEVSTPPVTQPNQQ